MKIVILSHCVSESCDLSKAKRRNHELVVYNNVTNDIEELKARAKSRYINLTIHCGRSYCQ